MNEQVRAHPVRPGQFAQKLPPSLVVGAVLGVLELAACPENGPLGPDVETVRVKHRPLVVVAQESHLAGFNDQVNALTRIRAVADDVAEAVNFREPLRLDVVEHYLQGFKVAMYIAYQSSPHREKSSGQTGPPSWANAGPCAWAQIRSISCPMKIAKNYIPRIDRMKSEGQVHESMIMK